MFCFQLRVRPWYFSSALMGLFAIRTICRSKCFILFFFVLRFLSFDVCGVPVCVRGSCRTSTNSWRCIVYSNSITMYCLQGDVLRPQTTYISKIKHRHRHSMRWTPMAKKNGLIRKKTQCRNCWGTWSDERFNRNKNQPCTLHACCSPLVSLMFHLFWLYDTIVNDTSVQPSTCIPERYHLETHTYIDLSPTGWIN